MDIIEETHANTEASRPPISDLSEETKKRTSEQAQLQDDPESDRKKLQQRREANRVHAFKSRQRSKHLLSELQTTVNELAKDKSELERHNAVLRAQVEVLQQQNLSLLQNQQQMMLQQKGSPQIPPSLAGSSAGFNFASNPFMAAAAAAAAASGMGSSPFGNNASLAMLATMMGAAANPTPNAAALAMMNSLVGGQAPRAMNLGEETSAEHSVLPPQSVPPAVADLSPARGAEAGAGSS
ncbi:hypothetical protein FisN_21Lh137 [Fistulifera solaris]|uniref:BZIP domain-containing protein n=1 Tax=Fistulifera solaris TaxID=1519565 RepID=A0A1Z5J909_FISSO|nr:hypothetical protein FisN_21Lh137 [Fistulifera solaris]|eukprot:GAX10439.1 hypothetical protein FisN_21Lh137 [Fistulifera solaris]